VTRLRVPLGPLVPGERDLPEPEGRYVARVHRLGPGDRFVAFDPEERTEADAEVIAVSRLVRVRLGPTRPASRLSTRRVTLLQGLGKGDKPERVVRDATALGVARIVFVETSRTVIRLADRAEPRRKRWRAVAIDAARQSGRGDVPEIDGPMPLPEAIASADATGRICLVPEGEIALGAAIPRAAGEATTLLVGPEGGFEPAEMERITAAGFVLARLGDFVLRTEIAAIAALGAILARSPPKGG